MIGTIDVTQLMCMLKNILCDTVIQFSMDLGHKIHLCSCAAGISVYLLPSKAVLIWYNDKWLMQEIFSLYSA